MNLNDVLIVVGSELATFLFSILGAVAAAGMKWGQIKTDMAYVKRDIAEIRQLFTLSYHNVDLTKKD